MNAPWMQCRPHTMRFGGEGARNWLSAALLESMSAIVRIVRNRVWMIEFSDVIRSGMARLLGGETLNADGWESGFDVKLQASFWTNSDGAKL